MNKNTAHLDIVKPFILENGLFRGVFIAADNTLEQMVQHHGYPDIVNKYIGQMTVWGLFMASRVKYAGSFTLQIKGNGVIKSILIDISSDLQTKGFARFDENHVFKESDDFKKLFGEGTLMFSVPMLNGEAYQGVVELSPEGLDRTFMEYVKNSEQIPTMAVVREQQGKWRGIFIQQMPAKDKTTPEEVTELAETIHVLLKSVKNDELFSNLTPQEILFRLFHANKVTVFDDKKPSFFCACYPDKFRTYLKRLPKNQLEDLLKDDTITVECEYCGQKYTFSGKDFV